VVIARPGETRRADPGAVAQGGRIRSRILLAVALTATLAAPRVARSGGALDMAWSSCAGNGSIVTNLAFDCLSNTGSGTLVCSFVPPANVIQFAGAELLVDLISHATPLPAWWALQSPAGCRAGSVSLSTAYGGGAGCLDLWAGTSGLAAVAGYGTGAFNLSTINAGNVSQYATLDIALAAPTGAPVSVTPGLEYFLVNVVIDHARSAGAGSCAGCFDPVCLSFTRMLVSQPGQPDTWLSTPGANSLVTWQGAGADCSAVPARRSSWGAIKSLYR
jgi:hypothetical protein